MSKNFNGNVVIVLFNWGWSPLINKLYLIRGLNLFAKINKKSESFCENRVTDVLKNLRDKREISSEQYKD